MAAGVTGSCVINMWLVGADYVHSILKEFSPGFNVFPPLPHPPPTDRITKHNMGTRALQSKACV